MFEKRSLQPERIDTGDYTPEEYAQFLKEIGFINRFFGDSRALGKTLLQEIERRDIREFTVLDVGAGSGELLRTIAEFAERTGRTARLAGLDLNEISAKTVASVSEVYDEIASVRGDAFRLPFADEAFDYAISSLFFHHLSDEQIPSVLKEMSRVARLGIVVIDLHRHPLSYVLYKIFCVIFRISALVRHDGSLSIRKGFKPYELFSYAKKVGLAGKIERHLPFRLTLSIEHEP